MNHQHPENLKMVATVADVARMVGLSRERFYQLQREGIFPMPLYEIKTRRPFYTAELQQACLEVRRKNCGINGKPVLFYSRCAKMPAPTSIHIARVKLPRWEDHFPWVTEGVRGLGLEVTSADVAAAIREKFPSGIGENRGEVIRQVFLFLKSQNRSDNVGG